MFVEMIDVKRKKACKALRHLKTGQLFKFSGDDVIYQKLLQTGQVGDCVAPSNHALVSNLNTGEAFFHNDSVIVLLYSGQLKYWEEE